MTANEKFNEWLKRVEPDRFGQSPERIMAKAKQLGHSREDLLRASKEIRYWLVANEGTAKVNKQKWGSFILNWLKPKSYGRQSARLMPSKFD